MARKQQWTKARLREVGVFNPHNLAGHGNVFLDYTPAERGRGVSRQGWGVYRVGFRTAPDAPWYDHGNKRFPGHGPDVLAAAKAWASERYGITDWVRTPFGSWMSGAVLAARLAELERDDGGAHE